MNVSPKVLETNVNEISNALASHGRGKTTSKLFFEQAKVI
jgi:hypothetical protein